jgi:hypothetical protein
MEIVDQGVVFDAITAPAHRRSCSFTNVVALTDGRILVSFRAGPSKDSPEENLMTCLSTDEGKSWKTVFEGFNRLVDGVPGGWRHGGLTKISPAKLMGCFCWFDRSDPSRPLANPQTQGTLPSRIFVMDSFDDGQTWTHRREINLKPFEGVGTTGAILKLHGGAVALPCEAWKSYYDTGHGDHHALLWLSHDGGQTFGSVAVTAHDPKSNRFFWDQRLAVDPETGKLIALFWTHDRAAQQDVNVHVAWGSTSGKDWTVPTDAGFAGQISIPRALPKGRVLVVYVHRHPPPTLRAVLSEDFGKTWDVAHELTFYESGAGKESGIGVKRDFGDYWADMNLWSFGHPEAALLPSGEVFVAFYGGNGNTMSMHCVRLAL